MLELVVHGVGLEPDSRSAFPKMLVTRVLRALIDSRVIYKSMPRRKYLFTREFIETMKGEITRDMPRRLLLHRPDFAVFDISGIETWTEEEFEIYGKRLRKHWLARSAEEVRKEGGPSGAAD